MFRPGEFASYYFFNSGLVAQAQTGENLCQQVKGPIKIFRQRFQAEPEDAPDGVGTAMHGVGIDGMVQPAGAGGDLLGKGHIIEFLGANFGNDSPKKIEQWQKAMWQVAKVEANIQVGNALGVQFTDKHLLAKHDLLPDGVKIDFGRQVIAR